MSALLVLSGSPQRASAPGIAIPSLQAAEPAQTGAADGQRQCEPRSRIPRSSAHGVRRSPLASVFHAKPPPSGAISGPHATARSERAKAPVCTSGSFGLSLRASATPPLRQPPGRPCRLGPPACPCGSVNTRSTRSAAFPSLPAASTWDVSIAAYSMFHAKHGVDCRWPHVRQEG